MRILISSRALVFTRHFHISHNAPYLPPPAPPQILHKQFLLGRMYAKFFLVGGGGGGKWGASGEMWKWRMRLKG